MIYDFFKGYNLKIRHLNFKMKENNYFHPIFPLDHIICPSNKYAEKTIYPNHVNLVKQHTDSIKKRFIVFPKQLQNRIQRELFFKKK